MPAITSLGVGSGLELEDMVSKLVAADGDPAKARLDLKEELLNVELSAFATLKTDLEGLEKASNTLNLPSQLASRSATVTESTAATTLSATADNTAATGTYAVTVSNLAVSHKVHSGTFETTSTSVGTGTITIEFGTYNEDQTSFVTNSEKSSQTVSIGSGEQTLQGVRDSINNARIGVTATIINDGSGYRLSVVSNDSGVANALKITVNDADSNDTDDSGLSALVFSETTKNMTNTMTPEDAALTINGLSVTSASNTLTEAIQGVTLELVGESSATITVTQDTSALKESVQSFVDAYNALQGNIKDFTAYDAATGAAGVLLGDSVARSISGQMSGIAFSRVTATSGNELSLASLGIKTDSNGQMQITESTLDSMLKNNYDDVIDLFSKATVGVGTLMENFTDEATKSTGGLLTDRTDRLNESLRDLGEDRIKLEKRLASIEERYRAQFSSLDLLLAQLNNTSEYLEGQLESLAKLTNGGD